GEALLSQFKNITTHFTQKTLFSASGEVRPKLEVTTEGARRSKRPILSSIMEQFLTSILGHNNAAQQ
ncbi:MAG: hypothetical protein AAGF25_03175, partial [Pseudomonadota bacterium]